MGEAPKTLMILGLVLFGAGLLLWALQGRTGWFGHLPGDIRIERPRFRLYAPFASMLILSLLASLILWLIGRFRR